MEVVAILVTQRTCGRRCGGRRDKTENALNTAVCNGTLTLQEAQHTIATDWFKYYRDHVVK
jgi:hypothetical protein